MIESISLEDRFIISHNPYNLLHDLHHYLIYVQENQVKRKTRDNELTAADTKKILKTFSSPTLLAEYQRTRFCKWLDFVETLALSLELVIYDIKGEFRGYTSQSRSFYDNYILVDEARVAAFSAAPPAEQMKQIINNLLNRPHMDDYRNLFLLNEFLDIPILGKLDPFSIRGVAVGQMSMLEMPAVRHFLFGFLKNCQPGEWYRVQDLIAYLKDEHPFFLFPEETPIDRWGSPIERYNGFSDGESSIDYYWEEINPDDDDAFERVEGRFVQRFFEHIPLLIGGVNLAYDPEEEDQLFFPHMDYLVAFQVRGWLNRLLNQTPLPAKVTVLPNFEILLESAYYHHQLVQQLSAFAEPVKKSLGEVGANLFTFKLSKESVAQALVDEPNLDVLAVLEKLSSAPIPVNVAIEIAEARQHADVFVLYEGYSLLETDQLPPELEDWVAVDISPQFKLLENPNESFIMLEALGQAPILVMHPPDAFSPLPKEAISIFPKMQPSVEKGSGPEAITVEKQITITLRFASEPPFLAFRQAFVEKRIPITIEEGALSLTIPERYQAEIDAVTRHLTESYQITFQPFDY